MKGNIFLYFFVFIFFATPTFGAIEPPYKEIEYCYRIDNISAFSDFVLIARFPNYVGGVGGSFDPFVQLKDDECFSRSTRDEIVAVRKDRFRESGIETLDYGEQWKEVEYFDKHSDVLHSGIEVPVSPVKIYDLQDPRKTIEDVFTIDALDDKNFSLRLAKKIITRDDRTVEEKVYATAEEGLADPPGPGYEYTDAPLTIAENPEKTDRAWYQQDWTKGSLALGVLVVLGIIVWVSLRKRNRL